jgi:hypothetical protein
MIEVKREQGLIPPKQVQPAARPILPLGPAALLEARAPLARATAPRSACVRAYCDDGLSSRLPAMLPTEGWKLRWRAPLNPALPPEHVVQDGDRVLAFGQVGCQLFDLEGTPAAEGRLGASGVVLDAPHGLFYFVNLANMLAAHRLSDGEEQFKLNLAHGRSFHRPFLARRGERFLEVGIESDAPGRVEPPDRSVIEHIDLAAAVAVNDTRMATNITSTASLRLRTTRLCTAMNGADLIFAVPGRIYSTPSDLNPKSALEGDFVPRLMSIDEVGRIHLVVTAKGATELWVIEPDGKRTASIPLLPELLPLIAPPILGADHRICLATSTQLSAFDAAGAPLWQRRPPGRIAGAASALDDLLLVAAGSQLIAYDGTGEPHQLHASPGAALSTPPAMSTAGDIFVASNDSLLCLSR